MKRAQRQCRESKTGYLLFFNRRLSRDPVPLVEDIGSLTTRGSTLIQTFPASFLLPGCKSDVEQVIGLAVPVKLAEYVASRLRNHVDALQARDELQAPGQLFERKAACLSVAITAAD